MATHFIHHSIFSFSEQTNREFAIRNTKQASQIVRHDTNQTLSFRPAANSKIWIDKLSLYLMSIFVSDAKSCVWWQVLCCMSTDICVYMCVRETVCALIYIYIYACLYTYTSLTHVLHIFLVDNTCVYVLRMNVTQDKLSLIHTRGHIVISVSLPFFCPHSQL